MIRRNGSPRSPTLVRLAALTATVVSSVLAFGIPSSQAQNGCSGSGCLPTTGYTFDGTWNCGAIDSTAPTGDVCYYNGTKSSGSATQHTWSWGSADYDGAGSTYTCIEADEGLSSMFSACGT